MGRRSHHASLKETKRVLKKEKIRSPNDAWKGYLKTWDWGNSQSFQRHCPQTLQGGFTAHHMNPHLQRANVLTHGLWGMAYGRKTQSFMKNESQHKCLDKALLSYVAFLHNKMTSGTILRLTFSMIFEENYFSRCILRTHQIDLSDCQIQIYCLIDSNLLSH